VIAGSVEPAPGRGADALPRPVDVGVGGRPGAGSGPRSGEFDDADVDGGDGVDADLVDGTLEGLLARIEAFGLADERTGAPLAPVVHEVVIAAEDVLREFEIAREPAVAERPVDGLDRRLPGVVPTAPFPAALEHDEQERKGVVWRDVGGSGSDVVEAAADGSDDPPVEDEHPRSGVDRAGEPPVCEFAESLDPAGEGSGPPFLDPLGGAGLHAGGMNPPGERGSDGTGDGPGGDERRSPAPRYRSPPGHARLGFLVVNSLWPGATEPPAGGRRTGV